MRDLPLGNGSLLINFDEKYQIRDVYFPHVGQENHSEGFPFRFGVWADGEFSWIFEDSWTREMRYIDGALISDVRLTNNHLGIRIECNDLVAAQDNIYLKRVKVSDLRETSRKVRVFLHQDLRIYENKVGDTAFYDPRSRSLIHYKKHRYFLINTFPHFDQFTTGRKAFRDQQGTWRDAEDGILNNNSITEGSVDSTIGVHLEISAGGNAEFYYWIAAGIDLNSVSNANHSILTMDLAAFFKEELNSSKKWAAGHSCDLSGLSENAQRLFERSLLIVRTQIDNDGAIIAATDHDVIDRATDHYSYLWPRDGAFIANALDIAGFPDISKRFFQLCSKIVDPRGYFLQKYNPDGTIGSGWHSYWDAHKNRETLPIQEDETALVIWACWEHQQMYPDMHFAHKMWETMIEKCADFLAAARSAETNLPVPTWNLWEDRRGIHTFTCATVVAGLRAAAKFAGLFDAEHKAAVYSAAADEIVEAMAKYLWSSEHNRFLRSLQANGDDSLFADPTVDASLFGIFYFDCFDADDPRVSATMQAVERHLKNPLDTGGIARFENDGYMRTDADAPGNPWIICTLWLADHFISRARSLEDLRGAEDIIEWVVAKALPSGVLAEQYSPAGSFPLSVSPLTWSHSTFIATVANFLKRRREIVGPD